MENQDQNIITILATRCIELYNSVPKRTKKRIKKYLSIGVFASGIAYFSDQMNCSDIDEDTDEDVA